MGPRPASGIVLKTCAAALSLALLAARAEEPAPEPPLPIQAEETDIQRLERAFWACDYVATTQGIQATPAAVCRYVTEELKQQKFSGSFGQMLEWWRANKPAEHRRIARLVEQ
jgi:hypothetical protein